MFKFCSKTGCHNIVEYGEKYCDKHKDLNKERYKEYNRIRYKDTKEKATMDIYNSKEWKIVRAIVVNRCKGMCVICYLRRGEVVYQDTVHHIVELKEDMSKAYERDNLICLCESCHQKVHDMYRKSKQDKIKMQDILRKNNKIFIEKFNIK